MNVLCYIPVIFQCQKELEQSRNESVDLSERLKVARHERSQALDEKDEMVKKMYLEEQSRKKAENEVHYTIL